MGRETFGSTIESSPVSSHRPNQVYLSDIDARLKSEIQALANPFGPHLLLGLPFIGMAVGSKNTRKQNQVVREFFRPRRRFLAITAGTLLGAAGVNYGVRNAFHLDLSIPPGTPYGNNAPEPISDEIYSSLSPREKTFQLFHGHIPKSWQELNSEKLIDKLTGEIEESVIPAVSAIYGTDPHYARDHIVLARSDEDMKKQLMARGHSEESAQKSVDEDMGTTTLNYYSDTKLFNEKIVYVNFGNSTEQASKFQEVFTHDFPTESKFKTNGFLNARISLIAMYTLLHEMTHFSQELPVSLNTAESDRLVQMYQGSVSDDQGVKIDLKNFGYSLGVATSLHDTKGNRYTINNYLTEAYRAYQQYYLTKKLGEGSGIDPETLVYSGSYPDSTEAILIQNFHRDIGVNEADFNRLYSSLSLTGIVDYYKSAAQKSGLALEDKDIAILLNWMDFSVQQMNTVPESQFHLNQDVEIAQNAWNKISTYIARKRLRF